MSLVTDLVNPTNYAAQIMGLHLTVAAMLSVQSEREQFKTKKLLQAINEQVLPNLSQTFGDHFANETRNAMQSIWKMTESLNQAEWKVL